MDEQPTCFPSGEVASSERPGASDWVTSADRTPAVARPRPELSAALHERAVERGPWPAGAALEPPPALWARIEAQLRRENIIES